MQLTLLAAVVFSAGSSASQAELLKTFHSEFISITPGEGPFPAEFEVGRAQGGQSNERPVHRVKLAYRFSIAKYEVPQNLWEAVMGSNPSKWKGARNSAEWFSFDEAQQFCQKATKLMQAAKLIEPDQMIRLPTEAEWEYVARAGTKTAYSFGDDPQELDRYGWFTGNAKGNDPPVGAKEPNAWGLYDIHGYLWEWCADGWHDDYQGVPVDGTAWKSGDDERRRVLRGGSWKDTAEQLTSSYRRAAAKNLRDDAVGLRCVLASEK